MKDRREYLVWQPNQHDIPIPNQSIERGYEYPPKFQAKFYFEQVS